VEQQMRQDQDTEIRIINEIRVKTERQTALK
jgi:hypothetical protein